MSQPRRSNRPPPMHPPSARPPSIKKGGTLPLAPPESRLPESAPVSSQDAPPSMPAHTAPLPPNAPEWMQRARIMSATIEAAIQRGEATPHVRAAITRAWQTWSLGGFRPRQIATVARIVDRAYQALQQTPRQDRPGLEEDCAALLVTGLPSDRRDTVPRAEVLAIVRELRQATDGERARIEATCRLLGWTDANRKWMRDAIASALRDDGS